MSFYAVTIPGLDPDGKRGSIATLYTQDEERAQRLVFAGPGRSYRKLADDEVPEHVRETALAAAAGAR